MKYFAFSLFAVLFLASCDLYSRNVEETIVQDGYRFKVLQTSNVKALSSNDDDFAYTITFPDESTATTSLYYEKLGAQEERDKLIADWLEKNYAPRPAKTGSTAQSGKSEEPMKDSN